MRDEVADLIDLILDEADALDDLIDIIREQREAMRDSRPSELDELMRDTREFMFEAQAQEVQRAALAKKLAARFGCSPKVSDLIKFMQPDERAEFNTAADRLTQCVFVLKSEMLVLNGLIDQSEKFSAMLLSEWRRIMGESAAAPSGFDAAGSVSDDDYTADFRG